MKAAQLLEHFDRLSEAPGAVPRLRRFILDLAVRGRLVPQEAGDKPAGELLKRLTSGMRKPPKKQGLAAALQPSQSPAGWAFARFADVLTLEYGDNLPADRRSNLGEYPVYGSNGVVGSHHEAFVHEPCIVVGRKGSAGALNLCMAKGCCVTDVAYYCVPPIGLDLQYTFKMFHTIGLDTLGKGIKPGLSRAEAYELLVPIPPESEQHRIVAKVDELMALCDQLEAAQQERERRRDRLAAASLQRLNQPAADISPDAQREHARFHLQNLPRLTTRPEHIKAMRQTILNLAVRGKLLNPAVDTEPASVLLKRLQADIKSYGVQNRVQPAVVSAIPDGATPYPLPAGWIWTRLASLCRVVTDGDHLPPPKSKDGVAFLTIGNVSSGCLDFSNSRYVSQEYFDKITPYRRPELGDLLYTVVGASYGRPVLVETDEPFCVQRHIAILKPAAELKLKYLHLLLRSPFVYDQATASLTGTAQPTIPLRPLRNFLIPLPPLAEQHRIVAKVDELMALCDQLEAQLSTTQTDSRRLLEAVLEAALAPA